MAMKKTAAKAGQTTKAAAEKTTTPVKPVKTETTKKTAAKKTTAKAAVKEEAVQETVYIQFAGGEYNLEDIKANVKKAWAAETGKKETEAKDIQIYVKPEEHAVYYVVNGEFVEGGRKISL